VSDQHHHPKLAESATTTGVVREGERNRLFWVLVVTAVVMVGELVGGLLTGSLALLNDAVHMFTHFVTIALSWLAIVIATRPAPPDKTYRYWRLEILASLVSGISLVPLSGWVIYESVHRWFHPKEIQVEAMLGVGLIGLVANVVSALLLHRHSKHDLNIRGAFLHLLADCLSSVGVLGAGAIIFFTKWNRADPLIAAAISVLVLVWCLSLVRDSGGILLESVPRHMKLPDIEAAMKAIEGVLEVHDLHVWTITSRMYALTAHVRLREDLAVSATEDIGKKLQTLLDERWEINHVTLQFEVAQGESLECEKSPAGTCVEPKPAGGHGHHHHGHDHAH
jgi:cobalt-zinc-cadmium efflux system protein